MAYRNFSTGQIQALDAQHHLHPFTDHDALKGEGVRVITRAEGSYIFDSDGKRILDAMAGLWCVNVGYGREELARVAYDQMRELAYYNTFFKSTNGPATLLSQRLAELGPGHLNHAFFGASGSESNDTLIRTIRHYWQLKGAPQRQIIISRHSAYHGSTMAAAAMGGMAAMHGQLGSAPGGFAHIMAPYGFELQLENESDEAFGLRAAGELESKIEELGAENVAAFVGEPIQGAGGVKIPPPGYWQEIERICRKHGILLALDEVITGFGRTGHWFGAEFFGIEPDMMTVAKAITSGYQPLSAVLMSDDVSRTLSSGGEYYHGYTYSGHPVACAVALANLDIIEREGLVTKVRETSGAQLLSGLQQAVGDHAIVGEVRGCGLLAAVEIVKDRDSRARFDDDGTAAVMIRDYCIDLGLMVRAVGNTMIFSPPLIWGEAEIKEACGILKKGLDQAASALL